jgi:phosphatidylglycerol:prolipoprotein diacylglycerol transferase
LEGIALFIILRVLTHRFHALRRPGVVTGAFFAAYGVMRIIAENFREPDAHIGYLVPGLTMGMLLSLPMILIGGMLAHWAWRNNDHVNWQAPSASGAASPPEKPQDGSP